VSSTSVPVHPWQLISFIQQHKRRPLPPHPNQTTTQEEAVASTSQPNELVRQLLPALDSRVPSKPFILTDVTSSTSSGLLSALVCSSRTHTVIHVLAPLELLIRNSHWRELDSRNGAPPLGPADERQHENHLPRSAAFLFLV
jgi:hypothetical protein